VARGTTTTQRYDDGARDGDVLKDCAKTDQPPGQPVFMGVLISAKLSDSFPPPRRSWYDAPCPLIQSCDKNPDGGRNGL
jgi:hypothetical protein